MSYCKEHKDFKKYGTYRQRADGSINYSVCWVCGKELNKEEDIKN
jgi:hypothetical protein